MSSTLSANEALKQSCPTLAGTIASTLADPAADRFPDDDVQFLKFHGIYQQDDRDLRKQGKRYQFMVRLRLPGGVMRPAQYLACDDLAAHHGNATLRITSRQSLQFHGVVKSGLGPLMRGIHDTLITTLAACGDVARNVVAPPNPANHPVLRQIHEHARRLSDQLLPSTPAYHQIWVEGTQLELEPKPTPFADPLYGRTYLPRKFKTAFVLPPVNDVDILTHCLGFIAIVENESLAGYNLTVGGGMGRSHNNEETFPRLADVAGFLTPDHIETVARAVVTIHRDFGDRANRRHARLKYLLADRGIDWFRDELARRIGFALEPARPFAFATQTDRFGWQTQGPDRFYLGLFIETGRIRDHGDRRLRSALRGVVGRFQPEVLFTPANNLILANVSSGDRDLITRMLAEHGIATEDQASPVRRATMACVALPTCGLALAEAERYLPNLTTQLEHELASLGLGGDEVIVRMTGCPNGCARPYMAEIGFVGRAPGRYQIYLGGNESGTRLARLYRDNVQDANLLGELRPLLSQYRQERHSGERFGDWCARVLWVEAS